MSAVEGQTGHAANARGGLILTQSGSGTAQFAVTHNSFSWCGRVSCLGLGKLMRRREFITLVGSAAAWPVATRAQQPEQVRRVGLLMNVAAKDRVGQARIAAFLQALAQLGWSDGRNLRIDTC